MYFPLSLFVGSHCLTHIAERIQKWVLCRGFKVMTIPHAQALKDNLYVISLLKAIIELRDLWLDTEPGHEAL